MHSVHFGRALCQSTWSQLPRKVGKMEETPSSEKYAKPVNFFFQEMDNLEIGKWLDQAEDDFAYGCDGVVSHPCGAAWNFYQAAEKVIKAVLISQD